MTERPFPREFTVSGPIPTDFIVGSLGLLTRVLSFSQIGALSWENSKISYRVWDRFHLRCPHHSVNVFPTLSKGLPLGLVESV